MEDLNLADIWFQQDEFTYRTASETVTQLRIDLGEQIGRLNGKFWRLKIVFCRAMLSDMIETVGALEANIEEFINDLLEEYVKILSVKHRKRFHKFL